MILNTPDSVTPDRLSAILRRAGCLGDASVKALRYEGIGAGLFGDAVRFHIAYDRPAPDAPRTLAGKFPAADPEVRRAGAELGLYATEVRFYQEVAPALQVRAPRSYYAEVDPETSEFGLLMADVAPSRSIDQLAGCTMAEAEHALRQAAQLHAPRFGDEALWSVPWMKARYRVYGQVCADLPKFLQTFRARFADVLEPEYLKLAEDFAAVAGRFAISRPARFSLTHGDFRLDNMLFDACGGSEPLVVLDWQSVSVANPAVDFSYLLGISYPIDRRSRDERDLLRFYHDQLRALGLRIYGWDDLWLDYRRGAWVGLMTAIFASAVAKQTEQGDRLFLHMARAAGAQMLEHDTLSLA